MRAHLAAIFVSPSVAPERQTTRNQYRCGLVIYFALSRICSARMARDPHEPGAEQELWECDRGISYRYTAIERDSSEPFEL